MKLKQYKLLLTFTVALVFCSISLSLYADGIDSIGTWKEISPIPYKPKLADESMSIGLTALAGENKVFITVNWDDAYVYDINKNQ
ncbi:hypothetical protein [Lutispora thermophila]|uniref:Uncharacterized protein n=1 Tax=Lutispora thermophila DSM 19022 TaxID=1122184 RepID=A0A1M6DSE1_9FIRM|nr:hypothetical protein [Lutispora thermophila]SHI76164.1 hypothetical protein SAMN02745176_01265 [Lutispora thermophila DSM 19022]